MGLDLHPAAAHGLESGRFRKLFKQAGQLAPPHLGEAHVILERKHGLDIVQGDSARRHRDTDPAVIGKGKFHRHLEIVRRLCPKGVRNEVAERKVALGPEIDHKPGVMSHHFLEVRNLGLDFHEHGGHFRGRSVREMPPVRSDVIILERAQGRVGVLSVHRDHAGQAAVHRDALPLHPRSPGTGDRGEETKCN